MARPDREAGEQKQQKPINYRMENNNLMDAVN
jgi:hypothetical protein